MQKRLFVLISLLALPVMATPPAVAPSDRPPTLPSMAPDTTAPAPPPSTGVDEDLQPQVTIVKRKDAEVEEYRMNGALYMVKVKPFIGPPYYLIDTNGDGNLNQRRSELDPAFVVPSWMIFRW
jgi:Protein of unknown function (DUF2782)